MVKRFFIALRTSLIKYYENDYKAFGYEAPWNWLKIESPEKIKKTSVAITK